MENTIVIKELYDLYFSIHKLFKESKFDASQQYGFFIEWPLHSEFLKVQYVIHASETEVYSRWLFNEYIISFFYKIINLIKIFNKKLYSKLKEDSIIKNLISVRAMIAHQEESIEGGFVPVINSIYTDMDGNWEWRKNEGIIFLIDKYTNEDGPTDDSSKKPYNGKPITEQSVYAKGVQDVLSDFMKSIKIINEKINK